MGNSDHLKYFCGEIDDNTGRITKFVEILCLFIFIDFYKQYNTS